MKSGQRNSASDEASEESDFLSALDVSLESFDHKALKDKHVQIECIHRIVCLGRDVFVVLPTGLSKSTMYQLIPKVLFRMGPTANAMSKPPQNSLFFVGLQSETVPALSDTLVAQ